ncbi:MAG: hypothetical protein F4090_06275 [Nitrospira sp. SB0672_bin_25]|nr:hypothetical protein [Nitrospira sp. SB0672_bin_25]
MGAGVRWKCLKDHRLVAADKSDEVEPDEREFFDALGELAAEIEQKNRSAAEQRFFDAIGFIRHLHKQ